MEEWDQVKSMDRLESEFVAAFEGSSTAPASLSEAERTASNEEQLRMMRARRGQVEAATELVRSRSRRIERETTLLTAWTMSVLRERNTMLALGTFTTIAAIAFVFLGMLVDPWLLTGAAAMSTIAGGCGYGLQSLRNRPRVTASPRGGSGRSAAL